MPGPPLRQGALVDVAGCVPPRHRTGFGGSTSSVRRGIHRLRAEVLRGGAGLDQLLAVRAGPAIWSRWRAALLIARGGRDREPAIGLDQFWRVPSPFTCRTARFVLAVDEAEVGRAVEQAEGALVVGGLAAAIRAARLCMALRLPASARADRGASPPPCRGARGVAALEQVAEAVLRGRMTHVGGGDPEPARRAGRVAGDAPAFEVTQAHLVDRAGIAGGDRVAHRVDVMAAGTSGMSARWAAGRAGPDAAAAADSPAVAGAEGMRASERAGACDGAPSRCGRWRAGLARIEHGRHLERADEDDEGAERHHHLLAPLLERIDHATDDAGRGGFAGRGRRIGLRRLRGLRGLGGGLSEGGSAGSAAPSFRSFIFGRGSGSAVAAWAARRAAAMNDWRSVSLAAAGSTGAGASAAERPPACTRAAISSGRARRPCGRPVPGSSGMSPFCGASALICSEARMGGGPRRGDDGLGRGVARAGRGRIERRLDARGGALGPVPTARGGIEASERRRRGRDGGLDGQRARRRQARLRDALVDVGEPVDDAAQRVVHRRQRFGRAPLRHLAVGFQRLDRLGQRGDHPGLRTRSAGASRRGVSARPFTCASMAVSARSSGRAGRGLRSCRRDRRSAVRWR